MEASGRRCPSSSSMVSLEPLASRLVTDRPERMLPPCPASRPPRRPRARAADEQRSAVLAALESVLADPARLVQVVQDAVDDEDALGRVAAAFGLDRGAGDRRPGRAVPAAPPQPPGGPGRGAPRAPDALGEPLQVVAQLHGGGARRWSSTAPSTASEPVGCRACSTSSRTSFERTWSVRTSGRCSSPPGSRTGRAGSPSGRAARSSTSTRRTRHRRGPAPGSGGRRHLIGGSRPDRPFSESGGFYCAPCSPRPGGPGAPGAHGGPPPCSRC